MDAKITLTNFSEIELSTLFEKSVRKVLSDTPFIQSENPENEFLRENEAREFLGGLSRPTFNSLRKQGKIPTIHTTDKRILFKKSDLIAYLNNSSKQSSRK